MLDLFNIAKPQGCDIQTFVGASSLVDPIPLQQFSWNKPRGVSHVYMMLIGAGGNGSSIDAIGGGSGAVTVWYGAAQHVPDQLGILPGRSGGSAQRCGVYYRGSGSSLYGVELLYAMTSGGAAMTANQFTASGFFQSVAGQPGTPSGGSVSASSTTFLSGGAYTGTTANYGYTAPSAGAGLSAHGRFQLQPIIVGVGGGGATGAGSNSGDGGIGCGGGVQGSTGASGKGGPGMVLIASW